VEALDLLTETSLIPVDEEQPQNEKPRGLPFEPGVSGNPRGRPEGSRNKSTLMLAPLLEGDAKLSSVNWPRRLNPVTWSPV